MDQVPTSFQAVSEAQWQSLGDAVVVNTIANTYLNYVLAKDARQRASATKGPFVAVGSDMWMIWRMVLQFKFGIRDVSLERR